MLTQVYFPNMFIFGKFFCRTGFQDGTFEHEVGPVDNTKGFVYIVVGNEYADVLGLQLGYDRLDIFNCNGVNTSKRLIEQDEIWTHGQGPGYFRSSPLTS